VRSTNHLVELAVLDPTIAILVELAIEAVTLLGVGPEAEKLKSTTELALGHISIAVLVPRAEELCREERRGA